VSLPAPPPARPGLGSARQVWVEVVERRRQWARQAGPDHFESWPAHDRRWLGELDDEVLALKESLTGERDVDPRAAAIDVMAVAAALIDRMG
jgi:hypothetical protein